MARVTLLNRGQRGPGQFTTASYVVTNTITSVGVLFDPHPNELDSTKQVKLDVFVSDDNGQTWRHSMGFTAQGPWTGGLSSIETDPMQYWGKRVMAVIDLPQQINCGVVLYANEPVPGN